MALWPRSICILNARVQTPAGEASSIRFGRRILDLDAQPRPGDIVVDAEGAFVLPGLINAHDHLELNHYGRIKERDRYADVAEWIDDMAVRLRCDEAIRRNQAFPLSDRLFAGALKNLLAGVTTVAHHNPRYRELRWRFPIRVVRRYGWAHSFLLQHRPVGARGEPGGDVRQRYGATPIDVPFIVHLAEGTAEPAAREFARLDRSGCVRENTVMVHGVAIDDASWQRACEAGASLVWCPASNGFLFGRTAPVRRFLDAAPAAREHIAIGSDSRLTGEADLLDELRAAARTGHAAVAELLPMVTSTAARVLKLRDVGTIQRHARADLIVVPGGRATPADAVLATRRADLRLVAVAGQPLVAAPSFARAFGRTPRKLYVDGVERVVSPPLAAAIDASPIPEPGVECR